MDKRLSKIKMVFADADNTLFMLKMYDENDKRIIGRLEYNDWLRYNIFNNAYINCVAPKGVFNLITRLHEQGSKVYGLTECSNSFELYSKYNRLHECYAGIFEHHGDLIGIDSKSKKVLIMQMLAEKEGLDPSEIMFIDDDHFTIMQAFDAGFFSMHTTEVMERFS